MLAKKTILIVEDESSISSALKSKLSKEDYFVTTAVNGKIGLENAILNHPDLILLDIMMPIMDGLTMLSELRKDTWGKTAKALVITNLVDSKKEQSFREAGAIDFLIKSNVKLDDIFQKIKLILGSTNS